jgi:DNA-binding LacI/PurR family transcriptional regulator
MMNGFRRACQDHDIDPPEIFESHEKEQDIRITHELADRADITALTVVGWGHCNTLVGRLADQGLRIPQDKSVLATGNPNIGDLYHDLDVTGIVCSGERLGREAARILIESPSKSVEKTLIGQFHKGSTLAPLSHG